VQSHFADAQYVVAAHTSFSPTLLNPLSVQYINEPDVIIF